MAVIRTHIVLPGELIAAIDKLVGPRKRSQFIADAVEERLKHERRIQAFLEFAGSIKDGDVPEWDTAESTSAWVRKLRQEWDEWLPPVAPH